MNASKGVMSAETVASINEPIVVGQFEGENIAATSVGLGRQTTGFHQLISVASSLSRLQATPYFVASLTGSSNSTSSELVSQKEESFGDWWSEYWSRQPFPSGYTQSSIILLACFISIIIFLIVVGNLLVCIAIFTEKSLKPTQNWFIASLAVSDMLLGLVVMPFSLARELMGFWIFGPMWCDIHEAMDVLLTTASINTLCLISLDRYWSITQAVSYLKKRTPRRGAFMIAFVWFFSAAVSLPPLFGWKKQTTPTKVTSSTLIPQQQQQQRQTNSTNSNSSSLELEPTTNSPSSDWIADPSSTTNDDLVDERDQRRRRRHAHRSELATPHFSNNQNRQSNLFDLLPSSSLILANITTGDDGIESDSQLELEEMSTVGEAMQLDKTDNIEANSFVSTPPKTLPTQQLATEQTTIEYPTCQLSDDVAYVMYSALGSFYIPCAVMVFTYIKIFLAARSRARRAINKQSRGNVTGKRTGNRRSPSGGTGQQANKRLFNNEASIVNSGQVTSGDSTNVISPNFWPKNCNDMGNDATNNNKQANEPILKGKIVIVERKKSLAASSLAPISLSADSFKQAESAKQQQKETNKDELVSFGNEQVVDKATTDSSSYQTQYPCTLITSEAKQASLSALNGSVSNESSMITVMNASMSEMPVTRFNFQPKLAPMTSETTTIPDERQTTSINNNNNGGQTDNGNEESRKAAALLSVISQVQDHRDQLLREVLVSSDEDSCCEKQKEVPDIVVERRPTGTNDEHSCLDMKKQQTIPSGTCQLVPNRTSQSGLMSQDMATTTSETCFMTIEEDSDMFDAQAGRTVTMPTNLILKDKVVNLKGGLGCDQELTTHNSGQRQQQVICNSVICRRNLHQIATRSASSYCGSSLTINDDDIDECVDDELLTDDCNGYSVSCGLDQYCPGASICPHCQECEQDRSPSHHCVSIGDSPAKRQQQQQQIHHQQQHGATKGAQYSCQDAEVQSLTGDDNLSLTEYRSNEDSSSVIGHDVLDATEAHSSEKKRSVPTGGGNNDSFSTGARKKNSIGFRLARLGSSAQQNCGLSSSMSPIQQQQPRNLKTLRRNFFLKLNQLTSSAAKQQQQESKKSKQKSPTGKSSAQSSGTSYEPSVDCATTSNVHSIEYHLETGPEDSERRTSSDIQRCNKADQSGGNKSTLETDQMFLNKAEQIDGITNATCEQQENKVNSQTKNDEKALLLHGSHNSQVNENSRRLVGTNSMIVGSSKMEQQQQQQGRSEAKISRSITIMGSRNEVNSGTNRAYLASDNERHKRKLAKARERRATLILGLIMTTFICSWMPFFTFYVLRALCEVCKDYIPPRIESFIFWMGYCNSAINPIIYTIFNRDFRKAFRKILFKCL